MHYWTTIPKNRSTYHPSRGVREDEIAKIVQNEVGVNKDLEAAEKKLLATSGIRKFLNGLKTDKEKEDFRRHLRRYAQIYLPDCPWEVNSTNRYTIVTHEAAITARRCIRRNESIKYLSGIQVNITPEEEKEIAVRKKDFSIVVSSRNKCTSLFMGPARFANHDCDANAKLVTKSHAGIEIIATRNIDVGDEITVTYGENYFGEDNCECLCQSCENGLRNGWAPEDGAAAVRTSVEEEKIESYSLRRRRRDDSVGGSSRTSSVTPVIRPRVPKTRTKSSRLSFARDSVVQSPTPDIMPHGRKRPIDVLASPPLTPAKKLKHLVEPPPAQSAPSSSRSTSRSGSSSTGDVIETDVTSPEKESPEPVLPTPSKEVKEVELRQDPTSTAVDLTPMSLETILNAPTTEELRPGEPVMAASVEMTEEVEAQETQGTPKARKKYERRVFIKQNTPPAQLRTPGDYVLTPLLLSEPAMAWIQCSNCPTYFVQQNAYFTRSSCPRCERHSKIYGYVWPKTDKAGANDKEERVLDHRLIHRFLDSNDERKARGRKPLREDTEEPEEPEQPQRGRRMKRGPVKGKPMPMPKKTRKQEEVEVEDVDGLRRSRRARRVSSRLSGC